MKNNQFLYTIIDLPGDISNLQHATRKTMTVFLEDTEDTHAENPHRTTRCTPSEM